MTWLYVVIGIIIYTLIGGFICSMYNHEYDADDIGIALCWPLVFALIGVSFIILVPINIGKFVGNFVKDKWRKK